MQLSLDTGNGLYHIRAYQPGQITVNETTFTRSLIVAHSQLISDWPPQNIESLEKSHIFMLTELVPHPKIVLLGTGTRLIFPPSELITPLTQLGIGVEIMDTRAACWTYTALMAENRAVVAALLIA